MKNFSKSNLLLSLVGLLVSFFVTIGSAKTDVPVLNVCAYSLIVVSVVSFMVEAFRLLIKENVHWQWKHIALWLGGGVVGIFLGFLLS
nr:MAG TPA: Endomembrane protein 70 [Caudoviricetes sp.]